MKRIYKFNSYKDLADYINEKMIEEKGSGSEGTVYLCDDGYAYKLFDEDHILDPYIEIEDIITVDDIDLPSFALPIELYVVNGELKGYKSKYIKEDYISTYNTAGDLDFFDIDINDFVLAYYKMIKDIILLSKNKISMYDVAANLMFDGNCLYAIDTCYYKKEESATYEYNLKMFNGAIMMVFDTWLCRIKNPNKKVILEEEKIADYLEQVETLMIEEYGKEALLRKVLKPTK